MEEQVTEIVEDEIAAFTPMDLLSEIEEGARIYSDLTGAFMASFEFYGLTLREWGERMVVHIPEDLDGQSFRKVLIDLGNKTSAAHNYYGLANSLAKAFGGGADIKKADVVRAIVTRFENKRGKRPAATIVEKMADSYMKGSVSSGIAAVIVKDFWKQRLELFESQRKILEQIGMNLSVEMKYLSGS